MGTFVLERETWPEPKSPLVGEKIRRTYEIPSGTYSVDELVRRINYELLVDLNESKSSIFEAHGVSLQKVDHAHVPKFAYDSWTRRAKCHLPGGYRFKMSDALYAILGFDKDQLAFQQHSTSNGIVEGNRAVDINGGIHHVFVYCDVVEAVPVGDTLAPLLRVVETQHASQGFIHEIFNPPRYLPLQKKEFDTIEIYLRTDFGEKIPFESGKVVCTLHFRRAASQYFS